MRCLLVTFLFIPFLSFTQNKNKFGDNEDSANRLWYLKPATKFEQALPLGNGRLGIMVYGGVTTERLALNEQTLWSGGPVNSNMSPTAKNYLQPVRDALFAENYKAADSLMHFMQGSYSQSYAPLGNLLIDIKHKAAPSDYKRELNIRNAVSTVRYKVGNTTYLREVFVSHPDQLVVIKLTAKGGDKMDFTCSFNSLLPHRSTDKGRELHLRGWAPIHAEPNYRGNIPNAIQYDSVNAMRFSSILKVLKTDGQQMERDSVLSIHNATETILLLSMATSYNAFDKNPGTEGKDEEQLASNYLASVSRRTYPDLFDTHVKDFQKFFNRVSIDLGDHDRETNNTVARLNKYTSGERDNSLIALYYQFSRYLLISSSRPGGIPANLQGIWNEEMRPPWSSNYTTNINLEMNYWGAEEANLAELSQPLFDFIGRLASTGTNTAKNFFNAGGWTCNHNSDIWAMTNPVGDFGGGDPCWANWPMAGVWLSTHLWEHYAFTGDKKFLQTQAYPLMKGAVQFCLEFLTSDKNGNLVTAPSTSPENVYVDNTGYHGQTLYGGTADLAMIRELFNAYTKTSEVLAVDSDMRMKVATILKKLYPYQIGKKGNLQEWYHDWEDEDPHHRHLSHLFGAYPVIL